MKPPEFLDFHLKSLMQTGWSCIQDSGDFNDKMKRIVCEGSFLVTADVVSLHPSIPHKGILTLKKQYLRISPLKDPN